MIKYCIVIVRTLVTVLLCTIIIVGGGDCAEPPERMPIIGVLAQEISRTIDSKYPDEHYKSYIAASYVKFVEGGGSRVVPIWIDKPYDYYRNIMTHLNGVLLPGGATWFNQTNGYADAGRMIYEIAVEMNERNDYFPVWGTCLGFELLTYIASGQEHREWCASQQQPLPLEFKSDFRNGRMFRNASDTIVEILRSEAVTSNFHSFCVTEQNLTAIGLANEWRVMSVNQDWNGLQFISTIEHKRYPFYGVQFHPEKNLYEWKPGKNITHSAHAVRVSQYFARFFVSETRRNDHHFESEYEEDKHLIYNYSPRFTAIKKLVYEQCYLFPHDVTYGNGNGDGEDERDEGDNAATSGKAVASLLFLGLARFFVTNN